MLVQLVLSFIPSVMCHEKDFSRGAAVPAALTPECTHGAGLSLAWTLEPNLPNPQPEGESAQLTSRLVSNKSECLLW